MKHTTRARLFSVSTLRPKNRVRQATSPTSRTPLERNVVQIPLNVGEVRVHDLADFNVRNVFESGRLQRVAVNPDGGAWAFRIIDPRQFILTATFSL